MKKIRGFKRKFGTPEKAIRTVLNTENKFFKRFKKQKERTYGGDKLLPKGTIIEEEIFYTEK